LFFNTEIAHAVPLESGLEICKDNKKYVSVWTANTALTAGIPYVIGYDGDGGAGKQIVAGAPATLAGAVNIVGVPETSLATGVYGWVQIYGNAEVARIAQDIVAGDYLEVLDAGVSLTPTSTTRRVSSCAVAVDASTVASDFTTFLFGIPVEINSAT
jgi:hypothetical protein